MADRRSRPSQRALRGSWVMVRAFTAHRAWAVLALPWTLVALVPATVRGGLFLEPTPTGMVLLDRLRPALDAPVLAPALGAVTAGFLLIARTAPGTLPPVLLPAALLAAARPSPSPSPRRPT
ncbi:hypothetical protein AS188_03045 [Kocuria flava]|uniref:Uncharacterized protein n=1 Tax=Kocuria flava TaxID=446860 RepID=A0A0U3G6X0_9MICC|nr:hypothetical protein [Kocuria flava]ALU38891.1 hypothetical protein AS188_03045 [Kocuria flava]GEO91070.1 hypothetical protein KFL01_03760 [Kocuria flava]